MADGPLSTGEGITGAVVRERRTLNVARTDHHPPAQKVAGTELEPEALVSVPLLVELLAVGALNVYRLGEDVGFSVAEAEVIERFAAMAALAFNSARQRENLRAQARTDGSPACSTIAPATSGSTTRCATRSTRGGPEHRGARPRPLQDDQRHPRARRG